MVANQKVDGTKHSTDTCAFTFTFGHFADLCKGYLSYSSLMLLCRLQHYLDLAPD